MELSQLVVTSWNYAKSVNTKLTDAPKHIVGGVIDAWNYGSGVVTNQRLKRVKRRTIEGELTDSLIAQLIQYANAEIGEAEHRIAFNESLKGDPETDEIYDEDLPNRPENDINSWKGLAENLAHLRQLSPQHFDTVAKQFAIPANTNPDLGDLVNKINVQLSHAHDLSIVADLQNLFYTTLAGREDLTQKLVGQPIFRSIFRRHRAKFAETTNSGGFIYVGPSSVNLSGDGQEYFQAFVENFVNPSLKHLVLRERTAIEEFKEVAKAGDLAKGTVEGNGLGWIDAVRYVAVPYIVLRSGLLAVQNYIGVDSIVVDYILDTLGHLMDSGLLVGSFFFPSRGEVLGIAEHANYEKIARQIAAYDVGRKGVKINGVRYRDLTLYRNISATFTQEENMQVEGIVGWNLATDWTVVATATGWIVIPVVLAGTSSMQVSNNNFWTNAVNFVYKHLDPLVRERRRKLVAERPELIHHWGLERVVDPTAKNPEEDLRSLNPRTLEYLASTNGNNNGQDSDAMMQVRDKIADEVNRRVAEEMKIFENLPTGNRKAKRIVWQYIKYRNRKALNFFNDIQLGKTSGKAPKVEGPGLRYYLGVASDIPLALGNPFSLPGFSHWRLPEESYFNRSFNWANWVVPLAFAGGYYMLGQTEVSPGEIVAVQINDYIDILKKAGIASIVAGTIAVGAGDTAGACELSRAEVLFEQARKAKKYLLGDHAKTVENAIKGLNGATVYELPVDKERLHYDQLMGAIVPLQKRSRIQRCADRIRKHLPGGIFSSHILVDTGDEFNAQFTLNRNWLGKGTYVTAIRQPGEDKLRLYSSRDLGERLAQYKVNPVGK